MSPRMIARTDGQDEAFEMVFDDDWNDSFGNKLKKLFEAAGWDVTVRRPDGMRTIWEVRVPIGEIVTEQTVQHATDLLDAV